MCVNLQQIRSERVKQYTVSGRSYHNWRAGASQPSRTTGAIFLYIYILVKCSALWASGSEPTSSDVGI